MSDSLPSHGLQHARIPVHHQFPELAQTNVHPVGITDCIDKLDGEKGHEVGEVVVFKKHKCLRNEEISWTLFSFKIISFETLKEIKIVLKLRNINGN